MKKGIREVVGKTIKGLIVKEGEGLVSSQVFLLFEDDTYYEFYAWHADIQGISGLRNGTREDVLDYMGDRMKVELEA